MTTYYVAKYGDDDNSGLSGSGAKLTIKAANDLATSDGDTVEILDEGTYAEGNLSMATANVTIKHTASWLGRPVLDGNGLGGSDGVRPFHSSGANITYIGLEMKNYSSVVFQDGGAGYDTFHMSGCFVHDIPKLGSSNITNTDAGNPTTIKQCVMFFEPATSQACIYNNGYTEISNCIITSSTSNSGASAMILGYSARATASFSTFINRGATLTNPVIRFAKVINCIITGSGMGIASDDHTYNLVDVTSIPFRNLDNDDLSATGSGDLLTTDIAFVDGDSVGDEASIASDYQLQESSPAIDAGVTYNSIDVDLTGTTRPQGDDFDAGCFEFVSEDPDWTSYTSQPGDNRRGNFTFNTYTNLASNHKFRYDDDPKQAPFSVGTKGPSSIRGRKTPYKTTK